MSFPNKDLSNLDVDVNGVSLFGGTSQIVYFMLPLGPGATSKPRMEHFQMFLSPLINLITAHSFTSPVWQAHVVALCSIWLLTETVKLCKEGRVAQTVRLQGCRGEGRARWTRLAGGTIYLPKAFSASMYLIKWTACRQHRDRKWDRCVMMNALITTACHEWRLTWGMWMGVAESWIVCSHPINPFLHMEE